MSLNLLQYQFEYVEMYNLQGVFVARHLALETFTIIAKNDADLNTISTKMKKHFDVISMTTMQFPLKENEGVKQNVIYDLSLLGNCNKLGLPEDYYNLSEHPYRIKYATFLTSKYNQHRIFKLSGHIA